MITSYPIEEPVAAPEAHAATHAAAGTDPVTLTQAQITGLVAALAALIPTSYLDTDITLAADSDAKIATQKAVKAYVAAMVAGLLDLQGSLDASTDPNYPAASKGDAYVVTVAGHAGGAGGKVVEIGDFVIALDDNAGGDEAAVGTSWTVVQSNLTGITAAGLAIIQAADAAAQALLLGLSPTDTPTFKNVHLTPETLSYAASVELDFATNGFGDLALSGDVAFTTANLAAGRSKTVRVVCDGTGRTLSFPVGWKFMGAAAPASITAGATGILTVTAFGSTDADCLAAWQEEA